MDKAHDIQSLKISGGLMFLSVDGQQYQVDIHQQSERLAAATQQEQENFQVSPTGYGIHWPDLDEDLSIDGLIGVKHLPLTLHDAECGKSGRVLRAEPSSRKRQRSAGRQETGRRDTGT